MEILSDQHALKALETLKSYLTEAQKNIEDSNYEAARSMCYMPGDSLPFIINYIKTKETNF